MAGLQMRIIAPGRVNKVDLLAHANDPGFCVAADSAG